MLDFAVDVKTVELTRVLKRLVKAGKQCRFVHIGFEREVLVLSMDRTSERIPANGEWNGILRVPRNWVEALAKVRRARS